MKKTYQRPDLEYVSLAPKAVPLSGMEDLVDYIDGEMGDDSSIFEE